MEGEEAEAVTKQMLQGGVLVPVAWAGDSIKMVVTTPDQEAMVSISALQDRRKAVLTKYELSECQEKLRPILGFF